MKLSKELLNAKIKKNAICRIKDEYLAALREQEKLIDLADVEISKGMQCKEFLIDI